MSIDILSNLKNFPNIFVVPHIQACPSLILDMCPYYFWVNSNCRFFYSLIPCHLLLPRVLAFPLRQLPLLRSLLAKMQREQCERVGNNAVVGKGGSRVCWPR